MPSQVRDKANPMAEKQDSWSDANIHTDSRAISEAPDPIHGTLPIPASTGKHEPCDGDRPENARQPAAIPQSLPLRPVPSAKSTMERQGLDVDTANVGRSFSVSLFLLSAFIQAGPNRRWLSKNIPYLLLLFRQACWSGVAGSDPGRQSPRG